jgi:hypothetical protein
VNDWYKGYRAFTIALPRTTAKYGWARGKGMVKRMVRHWAIPYCFTMGDAQKGMVDAILDSLGC